MLQSLTPILYHELSTLLHCARHEKWTELAIVSPVWSNWWLSQKSTNWPIGRAFVYASPSIEIEGYIAQLKNLTRLDLVGLQLDNRISLGISNLKQLRELNIRGNELDDVGARLLAPLSNLRVLDVSRNNIGPSGANQISRLKNLVALDIGHNNVGDIGASELSQLRGLSVLRIGHNSIGDASARQFSQLRNLKELHISGNSLSEIGAREIAQHHCLTTLNIRKNRIGCEGAHYIAQIKTLRELNISEVSLGDTGAVAILKLKNLVVLEANKNEISSVGIKGISNLVQMESLKIAENNIGDAGAREISRLCNLCVLDISNNGVGDIGAQELTQLEKLTSLKIRNNEITDDGASAISKIRNLHSLDIKNNQIEKLGMRVILDAWLCRMGFVHHKLLNMRLNGDLSGVLPQEALNTNDAQVILAAFRRFNSGDLKPLNEAKMLVVGNEAVGKTSLVKYLVEGKARDPDEKKTPGAAIRERIETHSWSLDETNLVLNIWDFGGQEIMHGTHRYFLTARSLYLLVLEDRREDDRSVYEWLKTIRNRAADSPVIIVTNKCDILTEHKLQLDESGLKKEFPNIAGFARISCNGDDGSLQRIQCLKKMIIDLLCHDPRLKHVRDPIDRSWLRVKDSVSKISRERHWIGVELFQVLCESPSATTISITDINEQRALLQLLNDLGTVVAHGYARGSAASLPHTTLLDPNWLTCAIYTILNAPAVRDARGEFDYGDLRVLLPSATYPSERHRYIVDMMKHEDIGLCFELPDKPGRYLIPEALPANEPDYEMWPQDSLRFRFLYDFLPPGLIPRFIVKSHENLTARPTPWKTGVVLKASGCKILVRGDKDRRQIDIQVTGPIGLRRAALGVVLNHFEFVHRMNPEAGPVARVPLPDQPHLDVGYEHLISLEMRKGKNHEFQPEGSDRDYVVGELLDVLERKAKEHDMHDHIEIKAGDKSPITVVTGSNSANGNATSGGSALRLRPTPYWQQLISTLWSFFKDYVFSRKS